MIRRLTPFTVGLLTFGCRHCRVLNPSRISPVVPFNSICRGSRRRSSSWSGGVNFVSQSQYSFRNFKNSTPERSQIREIMASSPLSADVQAKLDKVADVKIDGTGKFKYILIKVYATDADGKHVDDNSKLVVRGRADCPYHGDIFDKFQEETSRLEGFDDEILGGGRILREGNKIKVYGYSQGYGKADHQLTVDILKTAYPSHEISWSDEGY